MKNEEQIKRITPPLEKGLPNDQVLEREKYCLVNKTKTVFRKTIPNILFVDLFSFFNILIFIIAGLIIAAQYWIGLTCLILVVANIAITLFFDIKTRCSINKAKAPCQFGAVVIRGGEKKSIDSSEIVLDDLVILEPNGFVFADGVLLEGTLVVDESALTGNSQNVIKNTGDQLFAGSYIVSGNGRMHAQKIGCETYIESIKAETKKRKYHLPLILKSLNRILWVIGGVAISLAIAILVIYLVKGRFTGYEEFKNSMTNISAALLSIMPVGLFLMTTIAFLIPALKLKKKDVRIHDLSSIEMLAKADVVCFDKTRTITDGEMDVKKVVLLGNLGYKEEDISQIMSNLLHATKDDNLTAKSLQKSFNYELTKGVLAVLPFNSDTKYSAASFNGGETFVLGAFEFLDIKANAQIKKRVDEYTELGFRVLVLGKASGIKGNKVTGEIKPIALIVMQEHICEGVKETIKFFADNKVDLKVISGDDPVTVSHIAADVGILNADKCISLAGLSDNEVIKLANEYTVFGRVSPEQKELLVKTLQSNGKTVAMIGDGANDALALKTADCSIAIDRGMECAKNVSQIVVGDFNSLADIASQGRRIINNVQRLSSLFLVKTMFSVILILAFLIAYATTEFAYPFNAAQFQILDLVSIVLAAAFLALENNNELIKKGFTKTVLRYSIPGAVALLAPIAVIFILYILQANNIFHSGIYTFQDATNMSVIVLTVLSLAVLFKVCFPLTKYRIFVFAGAATLVGLLMGAAALVSYLVSVESSLVMIDFPSLTPVNWFAIGIILILTVSIYLIVSYIVEVFKGEHLNVKN